MPRAFREDEVSRIEADLFAAGERLFARQGVRKTSIDELVRHAGISKGSFYRFYPSKEHLFFLLLERRQDQLRAPMLAPIIPDRGTARAQFEARIEALLLETGSDGLVRHMANEDDFRAVIRRVEPAILAAHQAGDQAFLDQLIAHWCEGPEAPERDEFAARLTSALLIVLKRDFVGDRLFPRALRAQVTSLADCLFGTA